MQEELVITEVQSKKASSKLDATIHLSIERSSLMKLLSHVQTIVEKRNVIEILSNVKLTATQGMLEVTATDMDIMISEKIPANITSEGSLTVSAHTFYDIVRKLPNDTLELIVSDPHGGKLDIISGNSRFTLGFLPSDDFPVMEYGNMTSSFILSTSELMHLIDKTKFAISTEETRYNLNGIYLHIDAAERTLKCASTDGHRLCRVEVPLPQGAEKLEGIIIPRKSVLEIRKIIDSYVGDVTLEISNIKVKITFENTVFVTKLIDGNFPEYTNFIPTSNSKILSVDSKILAKAIDRVSTITFDKIRGIKLSATSNNLHLSCNAENNGQAAEDVDAIYDNDPIDIGFNYKYLLDILAVIDGDRAEFLMSDQISPVILKDADDASAVFVVMPMRV